jgi:hypothetical protein
MELHPRGSHFPSVAGFLHAFSLVVLAASFAQAQSQLDNATLEENGQRDQR